jgi:hypothetical protein
MDEKFHRYCAKPNPAVTMPSRKTCRSCIALLRGALIQKFLDALAEQRWDDHRYYHHSRINQSLHLFSAASFTASVPDMWNDTSSRPEISLSR